MAILVITAVACTKEDRTEAPDRSAVTPVEQVIEPDAGATIRAGGATVEIPPGALDATGTVVVSPAGKTTVPGFSAAGAAVHVELRDASLIAPATVRLQLNNNDNFGEGELLVLRSSETGGWDALKSEVRDGEVVTATANFGDFISSIRRAGDRVSDGLITSVDWIVYNSGLVLKRVAPPSCENNDVPAWVVEVDRSQGNDSRLRWCAQADGEDFILKLRNNRPFAQTLHFPGVKPTFHFSNDIYTQPAADVLISASQGARLWVRSGQQVDVRFRQPESGARTQQLTIIPAPDVTGTIAVRLIKESLGASPDLQSQIIAKWDCITATGNLLDLEAFTQVVPAAVAILEECIAGLSVDGKILQLLRQAVISVADWNADRKNTGPEISLVVNAKPERLSPASRIHVRGAGPVVAGMTVREAEQRAGVTMRMDSDEIRAFELLCYHARPNTVPGLSFMVINESPPSDPMAGKIARASIYGIGDVPPEADPAASERILTVSGIHVGSTEADVYRTYPGRIRTEPHKYVEGGHYLTYEPADAADRGHAIKFATNGEKVTEIHAGQADAVGLVEGCA